MTVKNGSKAGAGHRIAHILHYNSPVGGAERATLFLARGMRDRGFESTAYCLPHADDSLRRFFLDCHIPVSTYLDVPHSFYRKSYLKASWDLSRDFRRRGISLVHCSDVQSAYSVVFACRMARIPLLCHVRVGWNPIVRRDQLFLRLVNHFAFVSQAASDQFGYRAGAEHRGTVVYDSVEIKPEDRKEAGLRFRAEFGIGEREKIVGMVARVGHHKDQRTFIQAAALLLPKYPDLRFVFVGDHSVADHREHYDKVLQWLAEFGVADRFFFTGHRTDVERIIAALDISVLCTHTEALGLAIIESMVQSTPVIGTRVGGVPEIIQHGRNGFMHDHADPLSLAQCIEGMIANPEQARSMAAQAFQDVNERFSKDAYLDRVQKLYERMIR